MVWVHLWSFVRCRCGIVVEQYMDDQPPFMQLLLDIFSPTFVVSPPASHFPIPQLTLVDLRVLRPQWGQTRAI